MKYPTVSLNSLHLRITLHAYVKFGVEFGEIAATAKSYDFSSYQLSICVLYNLTILGQLLELSPTFCFLAIVEQIWAPTFNSLVAEFLVGNRLNSSVP